MPLNNENFKVPLFKSSMLIDPITLFLCIWIKDEHIIFCPIESTFGLMMKILKDKLNDEIFEKMFVRNEMCDYM
jgi:hypothetical protein